MAKGQGEHDPPSWIGRVLDDEYPLVVEYLDELLRMRFTKPGRIQDSLRELKQSGDGQDAFYVIYYSLIEFEPFLEDVEDQLGEKGISRAEEIQEEYTPLLEDVITVYGEEVLNRHNPVIFHQIETHYDVQNNLLIDYIGHKGSTRAIEITEDPVNFLNLCATLLQSIESALNRQEDTELDDLVNVPALLREVEHVEGHLEGVGEIADSLEERYEGDIDVEPFHSHTRDHHRYQ